MKKLELNPSHIDKKSYLLHLKQSRKDNILEKKILKLV